MTNNNKTDDNTNNTDKKVVFENYPEVCPNCYKGIYSLRCNCPHCGMNTEYY